MKTTFERVLLCMVATGNGPTYVIKMLSFISSDTNLYTFDVYCIKYNWNWFINKKVIDYSTSTMTFGPSCTYIRIFIKFV